MGLTVQNLSKKLNDTLVLDDITLNIEENEFLSILGASGCGKTTLLRCIAGLCRPDRGKISYNGTVFDDGRTFLPPEKREVTMVFQSLALWPHMTVEEHLWYVLNTRQFKKESTDSKKERIKKMLGFVFLTDKAGQYPVTLSGGEKQRVALARAFITRPKFILMDEPLSALDVELQREMRREIKQLHQKLGSSILYVTHNQAEALSMSDRVLLLRKGKTEQIGAPKQIYQYPQNEWTAGFIGNYNILQGKWQGNCFRTRQGDISLQGDLVAEYFKQNHCYPIRPEELKLSKELHENSMPGEVVSAEYLGSGTLYQIKIGEDSQIKVFSVQNDYLVAEKVFVYPR